MFKIAKNLYFPSPTGKGITLQPRYPQKELFKNFMEWVKETPYSNNLPNFQPKDAVGILGTGVGKTLAACACIAGFLHTKPNAQVLYVTHRGVLYDNALDTLNSRLPYMSLHGECLCNSLQPPPEDTEQNLICDTKILYTRVNQA